MANIGSWDKIEINGKEYIRFRKRYNGKQKIFYGKIRKEVVRKVEDFENSNNLVETDVVKKETLLNYMKNWLDNVKKNTVKQRTYDTLSDTIKYYIEPYDIAQMQMSRLNGDMIQKHFDFMATKYSMSVIKKVKSILSMVFEYAMMKHHISEDPIRFCMLPSQANIEVKKKEIEILTDDEMERLFNECGRINTDAIRINGAPGTEVYKGTNRYIIILILYTGLRIGECLSLKWKNYNKKDGLLFVEESSGKVKTQEKHEDGKTIRKVVENSTKTYSGTRYIPLPSRAVWALEKLEQYKQNDYIAVTVNGNRPSESTITRTLHAMVRAIGADVEHNSFGLHDLRHTYVSYLIRHGEDVFVVSKLIGHKSPDTTMRIYAHVIEEQKAKSIEIFDMQKKKD